MYKVYGPRQAPEESNNNFPPGLPQKRIRLVHQGDPENPNATRAARLSWTDESDTNLNVPDFLLKQTPARDSKINRRQVGLGIIFVSAFLLSFCGVFLFSHYFQTDAAQLLEGLRSQTAGQSEPAETLIAQATTATVAPAPQKEETATVAETVDPPSQPVTAAPAKPVAEAPAEPVADEPVEPAAVEPSEPTPTPAPNLAESIPEAGDTPAIAAKANARAEIANTEATGPQSNVSLMPTMVAIKPGQYVIPASRNDLQTNQFLPVDLEAFEISTTEVTRGQWQACSQDGLCSTEGFPNQYFVENKLTLPITSITTNQMMGFIDWINTKRSPGEPPYRLPAEAEWIVAARGGSSDHTSFAWGESFDPSKIRSNDMLVPVDHNEPINGLFGMSDNAAERVSGCWITEMADGNCYRNLGIVRGPVPGRINERSVSLTHRSSRAKNIAYENIGFRLAR